MDTLDMLARFPLVLREVVAAVPEARVRDRARAGGFSVVEHAWHLADLEEEGFGARIERLLREEKPLLPDFAGDAIALARGYAREAPEPAVERFAWHRQTNRERLAGLQPIDLARSGVQEGVGEVSLGRLPKLMLEHDLAHATELVALLCELDVRVPAALTRFAAGHRSVPGV